MSTPPVGYPIQIYSPEFEPEEHAFVLYASQRLPGPGQPSEGSPDGNQIPIGFINVQVNWAVYDDPTADAKLVARIQGIGLQGGNSFQDLVFSDERYPSTLKIAGLFGENYNMAIVGGTGEFALAQGSVTVSRNTEGGKGNWKLSIRAMCPTLRNPVHTPPGSKDGPWGGNGGIDLDIKELPLRLESVTIGSGDVVDSLAFSYIDQAGNKHAIGPWGGEGGLKETIHLSPMEFVNKITGTTGDFGGDTVVTSITIGTNFGTTYGPFGKAKGDIFNTKDKQKIVGFYVRAGDFIDKLGVYV